MFSCAVCQSDGSRQELVDEVFHVDDAYVLVSGIPAVVCTRCGEYSFRRETVERVRQMVRGQTAAKDSVSMRVFQFVA